MQQLSPDNLVPQIKSLLKDEVSDNAKLAVVILVEQNLGQVLILITDTLYF